MTFASKAYSFYKKLDSPKDLPLGVSVMNPYKNKDNLKLVKKFLENYFSDNNKRVLVLGINPGRYGGGYSGINFTDGYALEQFCGIKNNLDKRRELSSVFIYNFIEKWGGAESFYSNFFLTAISPLGFLKNGLNYNYYDDKDLFSEIKSFIAENRFKQINIGAKKDTVILFGTGKNQKFFNDLNKKYDFFKNIYALEHPRFIMQYKRIYIKEYINKYINIFRKVIHN